MTLRVNLVTLSTRSPTGHASHATRNAMRRLVAPTPDHRCVTDRARKVTSSAQDPASAVMSIALAAVRRLANATVRARTAMGCSTASADRAVRTVLAGVPLTALDSVTDRAWRTTSTIRQSTPATPVTRTVIRPLAAPPEESVTIDARADTRSSTETASRRLDPCCLRIPKKFCDERSTWTW